MLRRFPILAAAAVAILAGPASRSSVFLPAPAIAAEAEPVYLVYYWRARPGREAEYAEFIRTVAEPIDEEARRAGVFEEVVTYTPALRTAAPGSDWTHVRIFKLKSFAAWDRFSEGLEAAARRVFPDEGERRRRLAAGAELRDLVRQEIWRRFD